MERPTGLNVVRYLSSKRGGGMHVIHARVPIFLPPCSAPPHLCNGPVHPSFPQPCPHLCNGPADAVDDSNGLQCLLLIGPATIAHSGRQLLLSVDA